MGPEVRFAELGTLGHGLGPELRYEARHTRHRRQEVGQVPLGPVVPPEIQMCVGASAERPRQHARMGGTGAGRISFGKGPVDGQIQHRLVPGGKFLEGQVFADHGGRPLRLPHALPHLHIEGQRFVVPTPVKDRGVVAQQIHRLTCLFHCWPAHTSGVSPLKGKVLPQQHSELVGCRVQLGAGDVGVDAEKVQAGVAGQLQVVAQFGGGGFGDGHTGRPLIGPLQVDALAVDFEHPVTGPYLSQSGASAPLVVDHS